MPTAPTKNVALAKKATASAKITAAPKDQSMDQTNVIDDAKSVAPATLRLKELVDRVSVSTGSKKKAVKAIVEAILTQLGLALRNGEMLNLPELGKVRVVKPRVQAPGSAMTLKLRAANPVGKKKASEEVILEPADQG